MPASADWRPLFPFRPHYLDLPAGRCHYVDEGAGAPLLMVHGNPTWSFYWRNLVLAFRDRRRAIAVDHLGCGLSDKPADFPYTLASHIENLRRLIDALDLKDATLLAHDWGGAIGLGAALQRPERFARIILFNTGAFPPPSAPLRIRACRTPLFGVIALRGFNLFARAALTMAMARPERLTDAARAGLIAPYDTWRNRIAIWRFVKDIPLSPHHPTWRTLADIEAALPSLADRPVQLIWGMRDWCFTEVCLRRFLEIFPRAETARLADAGHYVVEDAPEQIVPIIDRFLAANSAASAGAASAAASPASRA